MEYSELNSIFEKVKKEDASILDLRDRGIQELPSEIGNLSSLRELYLGFNMIQKIPPEIGRLDKLIALDLSYNCIFSIPPEIGLLENLSELYLSGNPIREIPPEMANLTQLKQLYLDNSRLNSLPGECIELLSNMSVIALEDNPFNDLPEEIARDGFNAEGIFQFLKPDDTKKTLDEVKILFVGEGRVGKTSIINRIMNDGFKEKEPITEGIKIKNISISTRGRKIRANIWDFGGQEFMHATHQFFLTKRSLYVLVLDISQEDYSESLHYWLNLIFIYGGESPIIVVFNKSDLKRKKINYSGMLKDYSNVRAFVETSCKFNTGVNQLIGHIKIILGSMEHTSTEWPGKWAQMKTILENMENDFISYNEYNVLCENAILDKQSREVLIRFLHDLGVILCFREDLRLKDTNILKPAWVTGGVYKIINSRQIIESKGVFVANDLDNILDIVDYPAERHLYIIEIMKKFEICYELIIEQQSIFLLPSQFSDSGPDNLWENEECLNFCYQYTFLPGIVITRFIVRVHNLIYANKYWKSGVVIADKYNQAIVLFNRVLRSIFIKVKGNTQTRREFLAVIRNHFEHIHRSMPKLNPVEMILSPENPGIRINYGKLLELEKKKIEFFTPEGHNDKVSIKKLLYGVFHNRSHMDTDFENHPFVGLNNITNKPTSDNIMSKKHVFISYCHDNYDSVSKFRDELLKRGELVWWDKDILPGQDWNLAIKQAINESYAIVLCFSKETTDRSQSGMFPEARDAIAAYRKYPPGSIFLIPIRLSLCKIPAFEIDSTKSLDSIQYLDMFPNSHYQDNLSRLIISLKSAPEHP